MTTARLIDGTAIARELRAEVAVRAGRLAGVGTVPALAVLRQMARDGRIGKDAEVVVFNTGSGSSYRT